MKKIVKENYFCICEEISKEEVLEFFKDDFYKVELISEYVEDGLIVYC